MENREEAIHSMDVMVDAIQMSVNVPECLSVQQIQWANAKMSMYSSKKGISLEVGQKVKPTYTKTSEHTGHSKMTWQ